MKIRYLQEFTVLGTAGGMYHFRDQIRAGNPIAFFVLNGDVCTDFPLGELYCFHKSKGSKAMVFISYNYSIYGVYQGGSILSNLAGSPHKSLGRHCIFCVQEKKMRKKPTSTLTLWKLKFSTCFDFDEDRHVPVFRNVFSGYEIRFSKLSGDQYSEFFRKNVDFCTI